MKRTRRRAIVLRVLGVSLWLDNHRVPVLPKFLSWLVYGDWLCAWTGHAVVKAIPWCFRCGAQWPTWRDYEETKRKW